MPRLLSLSRAAHLVGTTRGKLQKLVQDGRLTSFEGKVSLSELNQLYPQAQIEDRAMLDKVEEIIERARFKARSRTPLPSDKKSLLARAAVLGDELALAKLDLSNFAIFSQKLKSKIKQLAENGDDKSIEVLQQLNTWVEAELPKIGEQVSPHHQLLVQDTMLRLVTAQVQLLPSGHEFLVEGNTTLLEAGLSAGYALNYGCSNGNCGNCKARLVSGEVSKIRQHDYCFTEAEKAQNYFLMCCNSAVTDTIIEATEAGDITDIPLQKISAKVKKISPLDNGVIVLDLKTPRTRRLRFLAGQQINLKINDTLSKVLPIASCPCDDMNIQLHIDSSGSHPFSRHILENIKPADNITIEGPQGEFVLDDDATNPLVFIALDTGFAPIKSLIEHALTLAYTEHIHLYWLSSAGHTHYMRNQCRAWADAFDSMDYNEITINDTLTGSTGRQELAGTLSTIGDLRDLANSHVYVAGGREFVEQCGDYLSEQSPPRLIKEIIE